MNQAQAKVSYGALDIQVENLVASFKTSGGMQGHAIGDGSGVYDDVVVELRIAEKVVLHAGKEPSWAIVNIPCAQFGSGHWDESPYTVALNQNGPAGKIKLGSRATVYARTADGKSQVLMVGTVVEVHHDIAKDSVLITIFDDRWLLSKITCFGQAQYDPETKKHGFVSNAPCIFNLYGHPDCLDTPYGPRFAPTIRYGWKAINTASTSIEGGSEGYQTDGEPSPGNAQARARSWRAVDVYQYLWDMHASDGKRPRCPEDYGQQKLSSDLVWPKTLGTMLGKNGNRSLHHTSIEGLTLDAALTKIASRAGPYELYCLPIGNADNGNEVANGPLAQMAGGLYQSLQTTFDSNMATLTAAFNTGFGAFETALTATTNAFSAAMGNYVEQLGRPYDNDAINKVNELGAWIRDQLNQLSVTDQVNAASFRANYQAYYQQYAAALGVALNNQPGRYALSNGGIAGGPLQTATNGVGAGTAQRPGVIGDPVGMTLEKLSKNLNFGGSSTLTLLDMRAPQRNEGIIVPAIYDMGIGTTRLHEAMATSGAVNAGVFTESIVNFYHDVVIVGDAPVYESTWSMDPADTVGGGYLEKAWETVDQTAFTNYVTAQGNTRKAFLEATILWPLVFAAYRIPQNYMTRLALTKHGGRNTVRKHPRIRPTLISGYQQGVTNPRNWQPRPILIEYKANDTTWTAAGFYDNLKVSQDGSYFTIDAQRDGGPGITWRATGGTGAYDGAYMEAVKIRACLAIELDWKMGGPSGIEAGGNNGGALGADPNKTAGRVLGGQGRDGNRFTYTALGTENEYVEWLRYEGKPAGQILPEAYRNYPDKATEGREFFTDRKNLVSGRMIDHANVRLTDVRRIAGGGVVRFPRFCMGIRPGYGIGRVPANKITAIPIACAVQRVIFDGGKQEMVCELASPAQSDIAQGVQGVG